MKMLAAGDAKYRDVNVQASDGAKRTQEMLTDMEDTPKIVPPAAQTVEEQLDDIFDKRPD